MDQPLIGVSYLSHLNDFSESGGDRRANHLEPEFFAEPRIAFELLYLAHGEPLIFAKERKKQKREQVSPKQRSRHVFVAN